MQIDLPAEVLERVNRLAAEGEDVTSVLLKGIERLEWEAAEVAAIQEGIDAYQRGDHEPWSDFARRFKAENGITPD